MLIVFHLEKFQKYGKNKPYMLFGGLYLLIVSFVSGFLAFLRCKTFKISEAYDKDMSRKRRKFMKSEEKKKKAGLSNSALSAFNIGSPENINSYEKKKTIFDLMSASMRNQKLSSEKQIDKSTSSMNDIKIICACCNIRESDSLLIPCNHAVYCQFCAKEFFKKEKKCKICETKITQIYVISRDSKDGEIYILNTIS